MQLVPVLSFQSPLDALKASGLGFRALLSVEKLCPQCGLTQPADAYLRRSDRVDGGGSSLNSWCKHCRNRARRENGERLIAKYRERSRRAGVVPNVVERFTRDQLRAQQVEWQCALCAAETPDSELEVDHIIPIAAGGPHALRNTQLICRPCNVHKSHTTDRDAVTAHRERTA